MGTWRTQQYLAFTVVSYPIPNDGPLYCSSAFPTEPMKFISVTLVNDPYAVSRNGWRYDSSGEAAIAILQNGVSIADVKFGDGYVLATVVSGLRLYSCYTPSSLTSVGFERLLGNIEASVAGHCATSIDIIVVWWLQHPFRGVG